MRGGISFLCSFNYYLRLLCSFFVLLLSTSCLFSCGKEDIYFDYQDFENGFVTISPKLTNDYLCPATGDFSILNSILDACYSVSPRYIKTSSPFSVKSNSAGVLSVFFYASDFTYLGYESFPEMNENETIRIANSLSYEFIKVQFCSQISSVLPTIQLKGNFDDDWDTFNPRSVDDGYHRISVLVNFSVSKSFDAFNGADTRKIYDNLTFQTDYGIICLPESYRNTGTPTRLIIYCHGHAVHYSEHVRRFDAITLEPDYWLAEGYAVMDMDGNPYDSQNAHVFIPQSRDSYEAGYKWAIEHYNLKKDGVFLGGRSMGGGNTFNLLGGRCDIPIIAACPCLPTAMTDGDGVPSSTGFGAKHRGYAIPQGFVWTSDYTQEMKQLIFDNWDKMVTNNHIMCHIVDLPTSNEFKWSYINNATTGNREIIPLFENLKMKVGCPVKIFACNQDPNNPIELTSKLYKRMMQNAGEIVELRIFDSYKDYKGSGTTAHHFDTQDPALRTNITTVSGEEMTNIPIVFIEMLQFWRKFKQD